MGKMQNEGKRQNEIFLIIKILFAMYIVTGVILIMLAFLLYKMDLSENVINIGVILVYVISGFLGGFIIGKVKKARKFIWGMLIGGLYFLILMAASLIFNKGLGSDMTHFFSTLVLCIASGMVGGMLSS
ncbi:MAG: TIGR04086 family membrane protein [Roseburia sp.]|uniref:TIGR04086 family membrane protein n=1 Tax=Roseburia hominis TaxID=301301 RepID=UPI001F422DD9|nr:TIGR04086 family membrane protein [Roseburia hominis]